MKVGIRFCGVGDKVGIREYLRYLESKALVEMYWEIRKELGVSHIKLPPKGKYQLTIEDGCYCSKKIELTEKINPQYKHNGLLGFNLKLIREIYDDVITNKLIEELDKNKELKELLSNAQSTKHIYILKMLKERNTACNLHPTNFILCFNI